MEYGIIAVIIAITVRLLAPWRAKNEQNVAHRRKVAMFGITFLVLIFGVIGFFAYQQQQEFQRIDKWLSSNNLNKYGDKQGTEYPYGEPQIYDQNGQPTSNYMVIKQKFPDKPWLSE